MSANLEFEETILQARVKKEVTCTETLSQGDKVKLEIGDHELDEMVPRNKSWYVVGNIRVIETDAE